MSYQYSIVFVPPAPGLKVLPPAQNTMPPPGFQTTVNSAYLQSWEQAVGQQAALDANATLAGEYINGEFATWLSSYTGGHIDGGNPDAPPPQPPAGAMVQVQPNGIQWDLIQTGPPVCSVPAYTKIPAPQTPEQAKQMLQTLGGGAASSASPFNASVPLYSQPVTAPDGTKWVRVQ